MSTKTSIKRIAAVAAVALTLGGFSAVSAHAAAASSAAATTATPVVGTYDAITITLGTNDKIVTVTSSGVGSIYAPSVAAATNVVATTGISATGVTIFHAADANAVPGNASNDVFAAATFSISAFSATAGTQTLTVKGDSTASSTVTLTWGAAPTVSTQYSTAFIGAGIARGNVANATTLVAPSTARADGAKAADITVTLNSAAATGITGQGLTASVTGAGVVGISNGGADPVAQGANVTFAAASGNSATFDVGLWADGRAGTATVTITSGTTAIATKTFTFYATPAKAVATQVLKVANKAGARLGAASAAGDGGSTVPTMYAYTVAVTDANGNASALATVKAVSSNTAVIQSSTCVESTGTAGPGTWNCDVTSAAAAISGQSATVTFEVSVDGGTTYSILANPLTFSVGGGIYKEVLSTDAASYSPLAPVKLTITATDSSGNAAYDQTGALASSPVASIYVGGDLSGLTSATKNLIGGTATFTGMYAPATVGDFTITATATSTDALSATASSSGVSADSASQAAVDAANEATDAANAATDAANNAMDSADAAQQAALDAGDKADAALAAVTDLATKVSAIASQIASLSALVKKIAAKVKA